jgi:hypothetical protein
MVKTFTVEIKHNPYDIECCIARVKEHPHLLVHGIDEDEAKENIRDLIRCHLDCAEGDGAGKQSFTCIYQHV